MEVKIRPAVVGDIPAISKLLSELGEIMHNLTGGSRINIENTLRKMFEIPEIYYTIIAERNGAYAGLCSAVFYKTLLHKGGTALINELVVKKEYRGEGIGRMLVENMVMEARKRGMDEIEVGTEKSNIKASGFYKKIGFDLEYILFGKEIGR
ncbi:MAG: GNAT family N-acetyltransferase [Brevinematales bacterium]|nr:GNAT family N-acetyltransferase [Brevinematales bacterium]